MQKKNRPLLATALMMAAIMTTSSGTVQGYVVGVNADGPTQVDVTCLLGYAHALATQEGQTGGVSATASTPPITAYKTGYAGGSAAEETAIGAGFGRADARAWARVGDTVYTSRTSCDASPLANHADRIVDFVSDGIAMRQGAGAGGMPTVTMGCRPTSMPGTLEGIVAHSPVGEDLLFVGNLAANGENFQVSIPVVDGHLLVDLASLEDAQPFQGMVGLGLLHASFADRASHEGCTAHLTWFT